MRAPLAQANVRFRSHFLTPQKKHQVAAVVKKFGRKLFRARKGCVKAPEGPKASLPAAIADRKRP